ncbi:MAG: orotidine-5'-phosphate decarboxylase [Planctomycetes bacterium]|nr:orotidine-5'-phosphate decarboxylase [Planctomycetota bacterium]
MPNFADRLLAAIDAKGAPICVGIDPRPDWIPNSFFDVAFKRHGKTPAAVRDAVRAFCIAVLDVTAAYTPACKPQVAFFEALGPEGMLDFAAICAHARKLGLIVIADVKRGDIGSTAEAYAQGLFGGAVAKGIAMNSLEVDCATINPYLGHDGVEPFIKGARQGGGGLFVLARTSNTGSAEFQELPLAQGGTTVEEVARKIAEWGKDGIGERGYSDVGAVVGATHKDAAVRMRQLMPNTLFLVPGYGAQGGALETIKACFSEGRGPSASLRTGAIVNSSRGVMHAYAQGPLQKYGEARWRDAVVEAARDFNNEIGRLVH